MTLKGGPFCYSKTYPHLSNTIITDCGVSIPYNHKIHGNVKLPQRKNFNALWDTGATNSVICQDVIDALNLKPTGRTQTYTPSGNSIVDTYSVNLYLPNNITFHNLTVTIGILKGFDILIGMDVICNGDFSITNYNNKTSFSFRIPSMYEVDFVKDKISNTHSPKPSANLNQKPNDRCACNSGKKFKHCCGKNY